MGATTAIVILGLGFIWVALLILIIRRPGGPGIPQLIFFQIWVLVSLTLGYFFLVRVFEFNPNPLRVSGARFLTKDRMIYLGDIVPGVFDLDYIYRIDASAPQERTASGEDPLEDWIVLYQYDVVGAQS